MPPPNLIPCGFCSRLYSIYSLKHHTPKCSENPENFRPSSAGAAAGIGNSKVRRRNTTSGRSKSNSRKGESRSAGLKRSKSVGSSSRRPETQTINSQIGYLKLKETIEKRPCFVCGKYFKPERLESHSRKCEIDWKKARNEMSKFISVSSPISVQIPSIDGTVDLARVDQLAVISAEKAQTAKCNKCFKEMNFGEALLHRCQKRREPTIEFFF